MIRSFNSNKPFDQFAMEQIAGDLMPAKNLDPLIASGYVRLGVSSNEGGTIPEELRVNIARDRTEAFGATFMGLTVGCAVCHDHKFDPTTQKDFYSLSAFFNNIDEKPFNDDRPVWAPVVRIPKTQNRKRTTACGEAIGACADTAQRSMRAARARRWSSIGSHRARTCRSPCRPTSWLLRLRLDEGSGDVLHNSAPHAQPGELPGYGKSKPRMGRDHVAVARFPHARRARASCWTRPATTKTNQAFSSGGWFMMRSAPYFALR